jgi:ammonium transporter, Amt family
MSDCVISPGDTTWVLLSSVLVLTMMPALAFFESGMLRTKNTLSIISQVFGGIIVLTTLWILFGYSLAFSHSYGGFIGDLHKGLFIDGALFCCSHCRQKP